MTDRTDHRTAAEDALTDAREWGRQAEEPTPEVGELTCLAYAQVHALLAIHDTLTAADRYAANEERQREIIADYAGQPVCGWCGRDAQGREWPNCSDLAKDGIDRKKAHDATCERYWAHGQDWVCDECEAKQREEAEPDPLDEDDWSDRNDRDGDLWSRNPGGCWHDPTIQSCHAAGCGQTLAYLNERWGPLTFDPEPPQEATGDDLTASEGESGAVERGEADDAPEPLLCPECGEGIIDHPVWDSARFQLRCRLTTVEAVRALIEQAVEQAGGGRG